MARSVTRAKRRPERPLKAFVRCRVCGKQLRYVSSSHLRLHQLTMDDYRLGFSIDFVMSEQLRKNASERQGGGPRVDTFVPRSRAEMLAMLRQLARKRNPLSSGWVRTITPHLTLQVMNLFGGWHKALHEAGLKPLPHRVWSRREVISAVRERLASDRPLNVAAVRNEDPPLYSAACQHLGSWRRATEAAGLDYATVRRGTRRDRASVERQLREWSRAHRSLVACELAESDGALYAAVLKHFNSTKAAARALGLRYGSRRRRWSRDAVQKTIGARFATGRTLVLSRVRRRVPSLYSAACNRFGSWAAALRACGIPYEGIRLWKSRSREGVAQDLRKWVERHGPIVPSLLEKSGGGLSVATERFFGSIRRAADALRLPYRHLGHKWNKDRILDEMKQHVAKGGRLNTNEVQKSAPALYWAGSKHFGSWRAAVRACGLDYERVQVARRWTRETVAAELERWVRAHGSLSMKRVARTNSRLLSASQRYFGTVRDAALELGLPYERPGLRWSKSGVIAAIRQRVAQAQPLRAAHLRPGEKKLVSSARDYFGSWRAAIEAAGLDYDAILAGPRRWRSPRWSSEKIVDAIRELASRGSSLGKSIVERTEAGLYSAAKRHFGSWRAAVEAAGLDYDAILAVSRSKKPPSAGPIRSDES